MNEKPIQHAYMVIKDHHDYYGSFDSLAVFIKESDAKDWCLRMRRAAGEPLWEDPDDYDLHYKIRKVRLAPIELCDEKGHFPDNQWFKPWPPWKKAKR